MGGLLQFGGCLCTLQSIIHVMNLMKITLFSVETSIVIIIIIGKLVQRDTHKMPCMRPMRQQCTLHNKCIHKQ